MEKIMELSKADEPPQPHPLAPPQPTCSWDDKEFFDIDTEKIMEMFNFNTDVPPQLQPQPRPSPTIQNRWGAVAARIPGKTPGQLMDHFRELLNDINIIKNGCAWPPQIANHTTLLLEHNPISIPIINHQYHMTEVVTVAAAAPPEIMLPSSAMAAATREQIQAAKNNRIEHRPLRKASGKKNKRKVEHWTKEEHQSFVRGLGDFGRSKWKEISRFYVGTRNPMQ
ncbi:hypothetical protein PIB30_023162, partial [Stylosanthes scabra]|nr:hypothetical protein [Stylosanthes scabra]